MVKMYTYEGTQSLMTLPLDSLNAEERIYALDHAYRIGAIEANYVHGRGGEEFPSVAQSAEAYCFYFCRDPASSFVPDLDDARLQEFHLGYVVRLIERLR